MFQRARNGKYRQLLEGVHLKTLVHGELTLMDQFKLQKGAVVPAHGHVHEQIGMLISGKLRFRVGDETFDAEAGDSWCIPGEVEHSAEALEDSVAVEVFSPVREEYLGK
ncbi:Cupin 2, conserved barrel domain protein [Olavius algarvensis associated proteobacterium Delta 3]|nr:Cupin 2, conserved barrel domain protein [Olavius algarvensis associated proteobacterium Delta 3]